jgi:electron transport complex protein RnfD
MAAMTSRQVMARVLAALAPGFLLAAHFGGSRLLLNAGLAVALALLTEAAVLRLRGRAPAPAVLDGSAAVTGVLLALALPPAIPLAVLAIAVIMAIALGKQLYGGLGNNPFNPAIVGYAIVLVSFPAALAGWTTHVDGLSGATALTAFKYREGLTVADLWSKDPRFGALGGHPEQWLNIAYLAGGLALAWLRLVAWRVSIAMLGTLGGLALLGYDQGSSESLGSPFYHWFSGATMLGAWFFATDPVTHPASHRGQLLFGCLIGAVTFAIRSFGSFPDGMAFAILLANGCSAWLDRPPTRRDAAS